MKHPALDRFRGEERDYLAQQLKLPWRFSFSVIVDEPSAGFFIMKDVLTGKQFLLFSPGISIILETARPALWFNLIGFNGFCWQSYGPVVYYYSFDAEDIFFFATELNPDIGRFVPGKGELAADRGDRSGACAGLSLAGDPDRTVPGDAAGTGRAGEGYA